MKTTFREGRNLLRPYGHTGASHADGRNKLRPSRMGALLREGRNLLRPHGHTGATRAEPITISQPLGLI